MKVARGPAATNEHRAGPFLLRRRPPAELHQRPERQPRRQLAGPAFDLELEQTEQPIDQRRPCGSASYP